MSSQDSGAQRRPRSVDGFANWFANSNTIPRQGRLRRKSGRRRSIALQVFRVALPRRLRVRRPLRSKWEGWRAAAVPRFRREAASLLDVKAASPQIWAPTEHRPPEDRLALPRRFRVRRPLRSKWRDDLRVVPRFRRAAPSATSVRVSDKGGSRRRNGRRRSIALQVSTGAAAPVTRRVPPSFINGRMTSVSSQDSGAQRRPRGALMVRELVCEFEYDSQTRAAPAANMGPRRRGVPTIYFRWAPPRRLRVRRPPSFPMEG